MKARVESALLFQRRGGASSSLRERDLLVGIEPVEDIVDLVHRGVGGAAGRCDVQLPERRDEADDLGLVVGVRVLFWTTPSTAMVSRAA